jgi:hypothetical protein
MVQLNINMRIPLPGRFIPGEWLPVSTGWESGEIPQSISACSEDETFVSPAASLTLISQLTGPQSSPYMDSDASGVTSTAVTIYCFLRAFTGNETPGVTDDP